MAENEYMDDFESMYEAEMEIARELEMNFTENKAVSTTGKPSITSIKRNLFSDDVENSSIAANSNDLPKSSLPSNDQSNQLIKPRANKKPRSEQSLDDYIDELLIKSPKHKKQKIDNEDGLKIINRILTYRQEAEKSIPNNPVQFSKPPKGKSSTWGQNSIHKHIPPGDFLSVTTVDGQRFYLDIITEEKFNNIVSDFTITENNASLLEESYALLKVKAENEILQMKLNEEKYSIKEVSVQLLPDAEPSKEVLWVEKYRPTHYLDLLSDEGTNKTVLRWLKLWDKIVFGKDFLAKKNDRIYNKDKKPNFFNKSAADVIEKLDEMGIPEQKVILLCGPPGLGKTTLAHVIARHAGYNVLEMNASDDRSTEVFKRNIENATSMKAVMGSEKKPNCLIIDEIDGAPTASISLLVNLLQGKKEQKKSKKKVQPLKRPIICICNDLYTLSLRSLRLMALIVRFMPTQSARLIDRLNAISTKQHLKADIAVLRALCNKTENDIRSCLSVLQFIKASTGQLRFSDVEGATVGQKDYQRSLFTGWQEIFTIPQAKKKAIRNVHQLSEEVEKIDKVSDGKSSASRFSRLLKVFSSCGEYDKLTLGWFENYPNTKFKHTHLEPIVEGLEWTTMTDILQVEIHHSQSWVLMKYLPYAFVAYHLLFATHQRPKLLFPLQYSDHLTKLTKCNGVISSMISEMLPITRYFSNASKLIYDLIPYIMVIIQPQLRPVNIHLYSQQEKDTFSQLVDAMISYNLTYQQDRSLDGQYSFSLDPNIEDVAFYSGIVRGKPLSYSCRQIVAREIEMEKVRRIDRSFTGSAKDENARKRVSVPLKKPPIKPPPANVDKVKKQPDNKPVLKTETKCPMDFFGRKIEVSSDDKNLESEKSLLVSDIWFKFKEGYSNAVRRPIKIKDLIS